MWVRQPRRLPHRDDLKYWRSPGITLPPRDLLVLDEAHRIEDEVVKFVGLHISKRHYQRYIEDYPLDDLKMWIRFLTGIADKIGDKIFNIKKSEEEGVERTEESNRFLLEM